MKLSDLVILSPCARAQVLAHIQRTPHMVAIPPEPSPLAVRFMDLWQMFHGPELVQEHQFHPGRRWRFDAAHLGSRTAFEFEGGLWIPAGGGRHQRPKTMIADCEKYLEAGLGGWRLYRLPMKLIRAEVVQRLAKDCLDRRGLEGK